MGYDFKIPQSSHFNFRKIIASLSGITFYYHICLTNEGITEAVWNYIHIQVQLHLVISHLRALFVNIGLMDSKFLPNPS